MRGRSRVGDGERDKKGMKRKKTKKEEERLNVREKIRARVKWKTRTWNGDQGRRRCQEDEEGEQD